MTKLTLPPNTTELDILVADVNGIFRGKRVPASYISKLQPGTQEYMVMPRGTLFLDSYGDASEHVDYGIPDGDPDCPLLAVSDVIPVPWADNQAQVLAELGTASSDPWTLNPRRILQGLVDKFATLDLYPVVAIELEFHLFKMCDGDLQPAGRRNAIPFTGPQTYSLDLLDDMQVFLNAVRRACEVQKIPVTTLTSEYGRGQFEINLQHTDKVTAACDQALMLRRTVRKLALQHDLLATFMAKPMGNDSGNGMHIHLSVRDGDGKNLFLIQDKQPDECFAHAIAGAIELMPASIAFFAQNANSYKRYVADSFVPLYADWGFDNRAVALRVPFDRGESTRVEHRVAGADSNPYLTVAAVLAGVLYGIENELPLPPQTCKNAVALNAPLLPVRFREALSALRDEERLIPFFSEDFIKQYVSLKYDEEAESHAEVTSADHLKYIRTF